MNIELAVVLSRLVDAPEQAMAVFDPAETLTYGTRAFRIAMALNDQEHPLLRYSFLAGFALAVSGESADHLLRRVDKAMYCAKVERRGRFVKSD
ncbi:hypothetical protein [Achromobacter aegrifaciens]